VREDLARDLDALASFARRGEESNAVCGEFGSTPSGSFV
jgi:hypothetical protein